MKKVYVSGPYTKGDVAVNVTEAMRAGSRLVAAGFAPFIPHLFHFVHMHEPQHYETWMKIDLAWVVSCHALIRLPGESAGGDREVQAAIDLGIPVYYGVKDFLAGREAAA